MRSLSCLAGILAAANGRAKPFRTDRPFADEMRAKSPFRDLWRDGTGILLEAANQSRFSQFGHEAIIGTLCLPKVPVPSGPSISWPSISQAAEQALPVKVPHPDEASMLFSAAAKPHASPIAPSKSHSSHRIRRESGFLQTPLSKLPPQDALQQPASPTGQP
jgi:hypothetical protein